MQTASISLRRFAAVWPALGLITGCGDSTPDGAMPPSSFVTPTSSPSAVADASSAAPSEPNWIMVDGRIVSLDGFDVRADLAEFPAAGSPALPTHQGSVQFARPTRRVEIDLHVVETVRDEDSIYVARSTHCHEYPMGSSPCHEAGFEPETYWTAFDAKDGRVRWQSRHDNRVWGRSFVAGKWLIPGRVAAPLSISTSDGSFRKLGALPVGTPLAHVGDEVWLWGANLFDRAELGKGRSRDTLRVDGAVSAQVVGAALVLTRTDGEIVVMDAARRTELSRHATLLGGAAPRMLLAPGGGTLCAVEEQWKVDPNERRHGIRCFDGKGKQLFERKWTSNVTQRVTTKKESGQEISLHETLEDQLPCELTDGHFSLCSSAGHPTPKTTFIDLATGRDAASIDDGARVVEDRGRFVAMLRSSRSGRVEMVDRRGAVVAGIDDSPARSTVFASVIAGKILVIRSSTEPVTAARLLDATARSGGSRVGGPTLNDPLRGTPPPSLDAKMYFIDPSSGATSWERVIEVPLSSSVSERGWAHFEVKARGDDILVLAQGSGRAWFLAVDASDGEVLARIDGAGRGGERLFSF